MLKQEDVLAALRWPRPIQIIQHQLDPNNENTDALEKLLQHMQDEKKVQFDVEADRWRIPVVIQSTDLWFKIVDMLQTNWATIELEADGSVRIYFISDACCVFDEMTLPSAIDAHEALRRNGFDRFNSETNVRPILRPPHPPFYWRNHPNGPIYSSGRYWL